MFTTIFLALLLQGELPAWGGLGVGGALAGTVLWFYVKREKEIVVTLSKFADSFQKTVEQNAATMAEVCEVLRGVGDAIRSCPLAKERVHTEDDGRQAPRNIVLPARDR